MNKQKQIEAAARLEKWTEDDIGGWSHPVGGFASYGSEEYPLPDYFNDSNAIDRLTDKMDGPTYKAYCQILGGIVRRDARHGICAWFTSNKRATCEQKLEAILRVYCVWEEEGE